MNICLFVDTNVYLRFYDSKQSNYKKLLTSLTEIHDVIFITQQIIDEVNRNKEGALIKSFSGYIDQTKVMDISLPDHISTAVDGDIKAWNTAREQIIEQAKQSKKTLQQIRDKILETISKGEDEIFSIIKSIPVADLIDTDFNKAIHRKRVGNPPGKREDPLGDQLNWERLLRFVQEKGIDILIMVSLDSDFYVSEIDPPKLNALLQEDLNRARPGIQLYSYKILADALKKFNEFKEVKALPAAAELQEIKEEEVMNPPVFWQPFTDLRLNLSQSGSLFQNEIFQTCDNCNKFGPFKLIGITLRESRTFNQYQCENCGAILNQKSF